MFNPNIRKLRNLVRDIIIEGNDLNTYDKKFRTIGKDIPQEIRGVSNQFRGNLLVAWKDAYNHFDAGGFPEESRERLLNFLEFYKFTEGELTFLNIDILVTKLRGMTNA